MRPPKPVSLIAAVAAALAASADIPAVAQPTPEPIAVPATGAHTRPLARVTEIFVYRAVAPPWLRESRTVALTFDDGPSRYTPRILDVLYRHRVPATFCLLGDNAEEMPAIARRIAREGHQICNHSRSHADLARASARRIRGEVTVSQWQIARATGVKPTLFRFPYGSSDAQAVRIVRQHGLHPLDWDVDPRDWAGPRSGTITARVLEQVTRRGSDNERRPRATRPGAVVLLHDGGGDRSHTAASLEQIIKELRKRGYRFVPV